MPSSDSAKRREYKRRSAERRKARDPEAERLSWRLQKEQQRLLRRATRAMGWKEHSQNCPVCVATMAAGSTDTLHMGRRVRSKILRQVARSALGKAASVALASGDDPLVDRVRMFLQALCPEGQQLLLPVLTSAGLATAPGTMIFGSGFEVVDIEDDPPAPFYAHWARREYLEDPVYMDAPATPEMAFEEWTWYEHRWTEDRLVGMDEVKRCLGLGENLCLAIAKLAPEGQQVAQRIRRCGLLGAYEGWVEGHELLTGLAWPAAVRVGLEHLKKARLLEVDRRPNQSMPWYSINSKEVSQKEDEAA